MELSNIILGDNVQVDPSTSFNNVHIHDHVKISKNCSIFGSKEAPLVIGESSYVGMFSILNGYAAPLVIGKHVSIAQNVNVMTDSGPNASPRMQRLFPLQKGDVSLGDHCWIGAGVIIMPGVSLGECCVVAANSFVARSFEAYTMVGGNPAREIRRLTPDEIRKLNDVSQ